MSNTKKKFVYLCCLVYFTSYITRLNYSVALLDITKSLALSDSLAGLPITLSFLSYGIGQLISGSLGDTFNPKKIITIGLCMTGCINISLFFTSNILLISVLWTINGFAQSLLWPPLVKIMLSLLTPEEYKNSCSMVMIFSSLATIFLFLFIPISLTYCSYTYIFLFCAILAFTISIIWTRNVNDIHILKIKENGTNEYSKNKVSLFTLIKSFGLLPLLFSIIIHGILRDGITTWMPTLINDIFNQSTSSSILITTTLPIFAIFSVTLGRFICARYSNDIMLCIYVWMLSLLFSLILLLGINHLGIVVLTLSLLVASMHIINLILIGNLPAKFINYNRISTLSGILNFSVYMGSALSIYGIAKIKEQLGWNTMIIIWIFLIIIAIILSWASLKINQKYHTKSLNF